MGARAVGAGAAGRGGQGTLYGYGDRFADENAGPRAGRSRGGTP